MLAFRCDDHVCVGYSLVEFVFITRLTLFDCAHDVGGSVGHCDLALVAGVSIVDQGFGVVDFAYL